jgi:hypothetical protein
MTFPRLAALQCEWARRPPAAWLIAAHVKYKPPAETTAPRGRRARPIATQDEPRGPTIAELRARFPGGIMKG